MKISLPVGRLLDDLYADSAIKAHSSLSGTPSSALSPDRRQALRRFIIVAAAEVAGALARHLLSFSPPDPDGESDDDLIEFEIDDSTAAAPDALTHHLSSALTLAALRFVALSSGDYRRADAYASCLSAAVDNLAQCISAPPRFLKIRRGY